MSLTLYTASSMNLSYLKTVSSPFTFLTEWHKNPQDGLFQIESNNNVVWHIAILNDRVRYATHSLQTSKTLEFYLQKLGYGTAIAPSRKILQNQPSEHDDVDEQPPYLWLSTHVQQLTSENFLSAYQANHVIDELSRESIETALWSSSGTVQQLTEALPTSSLSPWDGIPLHALIQTLQKRQQTWQSIADYIQSPYQRPRCPDADRIHDPGLGGALPKATLELLTKLMTGRSIRQLAQILKQDELKFAQLLYPYVKRGIVNIQAPVDPLDQLPLASSPGRSDSPEQSPSAPEQRPLHGTQAPRHASPQPTPTLNPTPSLSPSPNQNRSPFTQQAPTTSLSPTTPHTPPRPHPSTVPQTMAPISQGSSASNPPQKQYKIVCIDDNASMLEMLEQYLEDDCFEVTTVANPMQSISALFAAHPDLVLMDVSMPGINGHRLCQILKRSSAFKTTPIIMVSGNTGVLDKTKAKAMGATDYLPKPFSKETLLALVAHHLQLSLSHS